MRTHKYIRRTGSSGDYKYWYYSPETRGLREGNEEEQKAGKADHIRRLLAGRLHGKHELTANQIAEKVGVPVSKVREHITNMRSIGYRKGATNPDEAQRHGHDFKHHHMQEAHMDKTHPEYQTHVQAHIAEHESGHAAASRPTRTATRRPPRSGRAAGDIPETDEPIYGRERPSGAHPVIAAIAREGARREEARARPAETFRHTPFTSSEKNFINKIFSSARSVERGVEFRSVEVDGNKLLINMDAGRSGGGLFTPRSGEEDDDHPDFTGADALLTKIRTNVGAGYVVRTWAHEKGMFTVSIEKTPPGTRPAPTNLGARVTPQVPSAITTPLGMTPPAEDAATKKRKLREKLAREHGIHLEDAAPAPVTPIAAPTPIAASASPASAPAAVAVAEVDPAFAESEAPIRRMVEAQARGGNPYLDRATEIFDRIKADMKPERSGKVGHMLMAISHAKESGSFNEATILAKYKELVPGARTLPKDDFEKGTFVTFDEVISNEPINLEVERYKRGYAAKQFSRMKPFLKQSWTTANPSAPPPYPTFGDVKSWSEQGGAKPSWAGTTRLAMPKEVFDAAVKTADGKPQYPPAWMPIQLMPAWNYIAKKALAGGQSPYTGQSPMRQGKVEAGSQAGYMEGIAKNALRKYVQFRGGAEQLVDIPKTKLSEMGLTHKDIFKAEGDDLQRIITMKIIDLPSLIPFIDAELKGKVKKSFALVVPKEKSVEFKKSSKINRKAELIKSIKGLLNART